MRFGTGLDITREVWQVLRKDPKLLVFPLLSTAVTTLLVVTIASASLLIPNFGQWVVGTIVGLDDDKVHPAVQLAVGIACIFAVYLVQWFVVIYFNCALVGCALMRFSGGEPTVGDGLRIATKRLPQVFAWALVASVVGTVVSALEDRLSSVARASASFISVSWAVSTYFVLPVLVEEGTGPITSVRRSVNSLRKTWGEGRLVAAVMIGLASLAFALVLIALAALGFWLAHLLESHVIFHVTACVSAIFVVVFFIATSALRQVYLAGLYTYAKTGRVPRGFPEASMRRAITPRA